jgi:hypothetical protein
VIRLAVCLATALAAAAASGLELRYQRDWQWTAAFYSLDWITASTSAQGHLALVAFEPNDNCSASLWLMGEGVTNPLGTARSITWAVDGQLAGLWRAKTVNREGLVAISVPADKTLLMELGRGYSLQAQVFRPGWSAEIEFSLAGSSQAIDAAEAACRNRLAKPDGANEQAAAEPQIDGWILVDGRIDQGWADRAIARIERAEAGGVILAGPGGLVHEAKRLGRFVRKRGLMTAVMDECISACVLVLASGVERYVAPGAKVGVHQVQLTRGSFADGQASVTRHAAWLRQMGVDIELALAAAAVPHSSVRWLTRTELADWRLATGADPLPVQSFEPLGGLAPVPNGPEAATAPAAPKPLSLKWPALQRNGRQRSAAPNALAWAALFASGFMIWIGTRQIRTR